MKFDWKRALSESIRGVWRRLECDHICRGVYNVVNGRLTPKAQFTRSCSLSRKNDNIYKNEDFVFSKSVF